MEKKNKIGIFLIFFCFLGVACTTVPLTGRRQLDFIPVDTMLGLSFQQYDDFLKENKESSDVVSTEMVKRVGRRIQRAVEQYMSQAGLAARITDYEWEFKLIESEQVNAWCLPGGKVVVYTGIMPLAKDENGLAVIIGHEVAHAIAQHGNERMSQGLLTELGGLALSYALKEKPDQTKQIWGTAFGLGAQFGVLMPFSRLHESEADYLGLVFMAMAGYDPHHAVDFWQRMAVQNEKSIPEFLSTHPSDEKRIAKIKEQIPDAMRYYHQN